MSDTKALTMPDDDFVAKSFDMQYINESLRALALPVASLNPDPANANTHPDRNLAAIKASLHRFGQRKPVVVQKKGMIVRAGNGTLMAAKSLGWQYLACNVIDEDSTEATSYAIADNRTAELAEWDDECLASLLQSLPEDAQLAAGFDEGELNDLLSKLTPEVVDDAVPEPPVAPVSRTGDLWLCGEHRVLCGDSTKADDVRVLVNGATFAMMNTDPPYGVSVAGGTHDPRDAKNYRSGGTIENDGLTKDKLCEFLKSVFAHAAGILVPGAAWYVWYAGTETKAFLESVEQLGGMKHILVWVKPNFVFGRSDYHYRHEPVMYGWTDGAAHKWNGDRTQDSVWEAKVGEDLEKKLHPTSKPLDIASKPIKNHTLVGDRIYDPFLGSGTTLIAAEQLGRKCYGMEISPKYVDVIVNRWQTLTGKNATLEATRKTFADTAIEREVNV